MKNILIIIFCALTLPALAGQNTVEATDLIEESSTASHVDPSAWQERNPQHVEKNNPFDVLKEDSKKENTPSLDDILSGKAGGSDYYQPQQASAEQNEVITYGNDNEEALSKQATANKKAAAQASAVSATSTPDAGDAIISAVIGTAVNNAFKNTSKKKSSSKSKKSASYSPNCKSECKASGCVWQGETFTDPSTGLKGCVCGC